MKKKELADLHQKTVAELAGLIKKAQAELVRLRIESRAGKLKNLRLIGQKGRDLARLKTILKEKELNENT